MRLTITGVYQEDAQLRSRWTVPNCLMYMYKDSIKRLPVANDVEVVAIII